MDHDIAEDELTVGHEIVQHNRTDAAKFWTFVDVTPFEKDGVLTSLELFAGMDNRPLSIGIFRPTSDNPCNFSVIDQIEFSSFKKGKNKVHFTKIILLFTSYDLRRM